MECIVAVGKNLGIGTKDDIPWKVKEDLRFFREKTENNIVVMGWNTFASLQMKPLPNRLNIVLTTKHYSPEKDHEQNLIICNMDECMKVLDDKKIVNNLKIYIVGGEQVYKLFLPYVTKIHLTEIQHEDNYEFTKFFPKITENFRISEVSELKTCKEDPKLKYRFITYINDHDYKHNFDHEYLKMCKNVLDNGEERKDRTGTGTYSIFGGQMRFDIRKYIPVLTTKRVPWKSCIEELLWFLRGDTDSNILSKKGVNIWKANSSRQFLDDVGLVHLEEGDCGANYSFQWKHFGANYSNKDGDYTDKGIDQIKYIEDLLKKDKTSRRIFLSAWNPCDLRNTVLPPCHVSAQFYVNSNDELSCHLYQRSCDMFLGVPWNILSYSILTYLLAFRNGYKPGWLIHSTGDTHIYKDHLEQMKLQMEKNTLSAPILQISESVKNKEWHEIDIDDFDLIGYFPHSKIHAKMSA